MARANSRSDGAVTVDVDEIETVEAPIEVGSNLIRALDAHCWCGEFLAHAQGSKIWKCMRLHSSNPPYKAKRACQELPPEKFYRILNMYQTRPKKDHDLDNEIPDQAPSTPMARARAAQMEAMNDPNSARNKARSAQEQEADKPQGAIPKFFNGEQKKQG